MAISNTRGALIFPTVESMPSLRNRAGQFTSEGVQGQIARNQRFAASMQADVARRMRNKIAFGGRSGVSTGRLVRVTVMEGNMFADQWSLGIGRPDFLNKSVAKYWRTFEEGSAAFWRKPFVGTQLRGVFGGSIIGWAPTRTPGPQPQPLAGGPWGPGGRGAPGGKLRWYWNMPLNENFVVTKEIEGAHAYHDVGRDSHLDEYGAALAYKLFDQVFKQGLTPSAPMYGFRSVT